MFQISINKGQVTLKMGITQLLTCVAVLILLAHEFSVPCPNLATFTLVRPANPPKMVEWNGTSLQSAPRPGHEPTLIRADRAAA